MKQNSQHWCVVHLQFFAVGLILFPVSIAFAEQTVGGGTIETPAIGPSPAYDLGEKDFVLVKNWNFGSDAESTITNIAEMSKHFQYHDQFGTIANGTKYGAYTVAPNEEHALSHLNQPVEGKNTKRPVRKFFKKSLKTYLVPLDGAKKVHPKEAKAGCGSFQAKWTLDKGGSRLGRDILWQTRVRYRTPPYFWFAIWNCGNKWDEGAEIDVVESFGFDNGGGFTNYEGKEWHSSVVGGSSETNYHASWGNGMAKYGIKEFNAKEWHVWTLLYRADNTFTAYLDSKVIQNGSTQWTCGTTSEGKPVNMSFIFDGAWGHTEIDSVNHWLNASKLRNVFYEWDYSRVYLSTKK